MNKLSVKMKITLWYLLIISVISFVLLFGMSAFSQGIIVNDVKDSVLSSVTNLEGKVKEVTGANPRSIIHDETFPLHILYGRGTQTAIYDSNKKLIFGSAPYGIENILSFEHGGLRIEKHNQKMYYVYDKKISVNDSDYVWIKGIACLSDKTDFLGLALKSNFIITICFISIAVLGGYLIINKALRPVNKISETANSIINSNILSKRININSGNDEIHTLANTIDKMLDKIESSFNKERQFTSDASHELRTPISVILSECEYAEQFVNDPKDYEQSISSIKAQTTKMSNLVSELLAISRMDNDKLPINMEETDISMLLDMICDEQISTQNKNINLEKHIQPDILKTVDQLLITRLFINIISNAYQYSEENTTIKVSLYKQNEKIIFSVKDQGIGIDTEHIDKIWNRFYQVDSSRNKETSGLGLSMVKWIADKHNIDISVNSELGKGTEFIFVFK